MAGPSACVRCEQCGSGSHRKINCPFYKVSRKYQVNSRSDGYEYNAYAVPVYDTHCHLDVVFDRFRYHGSSLYEFKRKECFPINFAGCISSFSDPASFSNLGMWDTILEDEEVWGTFGVHPHHASNYSDSLEKRLIERLSHPKAVGVGECGLDYFRCSSKRDLQREVFLKQIQIARMLSKTLVIHSRDAEEDVRQILVDKEMQNWPIHVHCFTGDREQMLQLVNEFSQMCFGFTNLASYDTAKKTHEVIKSIPLDRVLLETDSPYFVPKSIKDKEKFSHPGNVLFVAEEIARIKGKDVDVVLDNCRRNTRKIFKI